GGVELELGPSQPRASQLVGLAGRRLAGGEDHGPNQRVQPPTLVDRSDRDQRADQVEARGRQRLDLGTSEETVQRSTTAGQRLLVLAGLERERGEAALDEDLTEPLTGLGEAERGRPVALAGSLAVAGELREVGLELIHAGAQARDGPGGARPVIARALVERSGEPGLRFAAGVEQREPAPQPRDRPSPARRGSGRRGQLLRPGLGLAPGPRRLAEIDQRSPAQPQRSIAIGPAGAREQPIERGDGLARATELLERPHALEILGRRRRAGR